MQVAGTQHFTGRDTPAHLDDWGHRKAEEVCVCPRVRMRAHVRVRVRVAHAHLGMTDFVVRRFRLAGFLGVTF